MRVLHLHRPPRFFISYRRADIPQFAAATYDAIIRRYSRRSAFLDIDSVAAGDNFLSGIKYSIDRSDCVIAIVGPHWIGKGNNDDQPRIFQEGDFVRLEIEEALRRKKRIVVLHWDTPRFSFEQLPNSIARVVFVKWINATELNIDNVIRRISRLIKPRISVTVHVAALLIMLSVWGAITPLLYLLDPAPPHDTAHPRGNREGFKIDQPPRRIALSITKDRKIYLRADVDDEKAVQVYGEQDLDRLAADVRTALNQCSPTCPNTVFVRGDIQSKPNTIFGITRELVRFGVPITYVLASEDGHQN